MIHDFPILGLLIAAGIIVLLVILSERNKK